MARLPDRGALLGRGVWAAAAAVVLTPPIAVGGGLAMAPLAALMGLIGAPYGRIAALARAGGLALMALGLFVLWAVLSALWSAAPTRWDAALKLVGGVLTGLGLVGGVIAATPEGRRLVRAAAAAGALMLCVLLCIEGLFGMPFNRLGQPDPDYWLVEINPGHGASILGVLMWPALLGLRGRLHWPIGIAIGVLGAFVATQFHNTTNLVAFGAAAAFAALAWRAPRTTLIAMGALLAASILLAPFVAMLLPELHDAAPFSWGERVEMWRSSAARMLQAPLIGHGLDSVRLMDAPVEIGGTEYHFIRLHPHNAGLHVWLELGAVGACLAAAALMLGGLALSRALKSRAAAAAAAGGLAAYAAHASLSLGLWQEWWAATAFVLAASVAAMREA